MSNSESQEGNQGDPHGQACCYDPEQRGAGRSQGSHARVMSEHARAGRKVVIWKDGQVVAGRSTEEGRVTGR